MTCNMTSKFKKAYTSNGEEIKDLLFIKPNVYGDDRGFFFESWNQKDWEEILNINNQSRVNFVQDNHSKSSKGVLRGLHFQRNPNAQGKLVRCINGEIYDIAVDLRKASKTFGKWSGINLSDKNKNQFWIPEGFAHGFLTLSDTAEVLYKTSNYWRKECEISLLWNDPEIKIEWPLELIKSNVLLSEKDKYAKKLSQINKDLLF